MNKLFYLSPLFLLSCNINNPNVVANFPKDQKLERKQFAGNLFGNEDGFIIYEDKNTNYSETDKNKNTLWNKTISVITNILPIASLNKEDGVILTDWGIISDISGNDDLYKINIIVKSDKINKDNINISVFKKNKTNIVDKDDKVKKTILEKIIN